METVFCTADLSIFTTHVPHGITFRQHRRQNTETDIARHGQKETIKHHRPDTDRRIQVIIIYDVYINHSKR